MVGDWGELERKTIAQDTVRAGVGLGVVQNDARVPMTSREGQCNVYGLQSYWGEDVVVHNLEYHVAWMQAPRQRMLTNANDGAAV